LGKARECIAARTVVLSHFGLVEIRQRLGQGGVGFGPGGFRQCAGQPSVLRRALPRGAFL
jgi:hypothetical protein